MFRQIYEIHVLIYSNIFDPSLLYVIKNKNKNQNNCILA